VGPRFASNSHVVVLRRENSGKLEGTEKLFVVSSRKSESLADSLALRWNGFVNEFRRTFAIVLSESITGSRCMPAAIIHRHEENCNNHFSRKFPFFFILFVTFPKRIYEQRKSWRLADKEEI
jgi:hypothetical protein